jgi:hypothetical protein
MEELRTDLHHNGVSLGDRAKLTSIGAVVSATLRHLQVQDDTGSSKDDTNSVSGDTVRLIACLLWSGQSFF